MDNRTGQFHKVEDAAALDELKKKLGHEDVSGPYEAGQVISLGFVAGTAGVMILTFPKQES